MNINHLHAVLEVEAQIALRHQIPAFRAQLRDEFSRVSRMGHYVGSEQLKLVRTWLFHLNTEQLLYQRVSLCA